MKFLTWVVAVFALLAGLPALSAEKNLEVGQVWTVNGQGYENTRILIGRIERSGDEAVVHISVTNAPYAKLDSTIILIPIGHMPFTYEAVQLSVGEIVAKNTVPPSGFDSGYTLWREDEGGVFTIPFSEVMKGL